jgi:uncharacterized membrane protein
MKNKVDIVRNVYLFGVSLIGIIFLIVGLIRITNSLTSIYFPKVGQGVDMIYQYKNLYEAIVMAVVGILVFAFHWYFIVKEKRLGRLSQIQNESSMNLFEAIFFYLLSFVGIMIFMTSLISMVGGFYSIQYPPPQIDKGGNIMKESAPYVEKDIAQIVRSGISTLIGLATFVIGFARSQISMKKGENTEINT